MSEIAKRALTRRSMLQTSLAAMYPALMRRPGTLPAVDRTTIALGCNEHGKPILLPLRPRMEHCHVIGTTGGGKSKFCEHCIRQDIAMGYGVLVVDPHGEHPDSLYRSLISWLDAKGYAERRTIHLVDPNSSGHVVGFNPLARPDANADISVVAGVVLETFERAWGDADMTQKPTIERVLMTTFAALAELGLTLVEAPFLLDRADRHGLRAHAIKNVTDRFTRDELQRLHELSLDDRRRHDYDLEIVGPMNRLARFLRPSSIRGMVGQTDHALDVRQALDEGHIILCNLSGGAQVYERDADLLGRLLTRLFFFHAKRRRFPDQPFFVYLDECHRYLSGDLENILAESRKYGIGAVLAHQWLRQFGEEDDNLLAAVRNATNLKVVFRIKDPMEAEELAHTVVPLDLEMPVRALVKPTVVGHRLVRLRSDSAGQSIAMTESVSDTIGESVSETESRSVTVGQSTTQGVSYSEGYGVSIGESASASQSISLGVADGMSFGVTSGVSIGGSVSHAHSTGSAAGTATTESRLPLEGGLFEQPTILSVAEGQSASLNSSDTATAGSSWANTTGASQGRNFSRSSAAGTSFGRTASRSGSANVSFGTSFAETSSVSESEGYAISHGRSHARSFGRAGTVGSSRAEGSSEAFEPLYADLPSAVHSKENVLYMAAQTLRNLQTGVAFINYVGKTGMVPVLLTVPRISEQPLSGEEFAALRERLLSRSAAAMPIAQAARLVDQREQRLLAARITSTQEAEPKSFRTCAPVQSAVERGRSRPDGAGRGSTRSPMNTRKGVR